MPKTAIIYIHPLHGEMYIDRNSQAYELYQHKQFTKLDKHLTSLLRK